MIETFLDERNVLWCKNAQAVYLKKYGSERPSELKEKMRQSRFLQSRGFSGEQIRYAMRDNDD